MQYLSDIAITTLREPVLRVLSYYDIFEYPLTSAEIFTFLTVSGVTLSELEQALRELTAECEIGMYKSFYFLPGRGNHAVHRRLAMEETGAHMWEKARVMGKLMSYTPFVRGVFVSGQLSRYIADEKSDIDYFIVTTPGRLWIVRFLFVLFRRTILLNRRKYFCTNYFITTENLRIEEHNPYTACEIASLKPLVNRELFNEFVRQNQWVTNYYPNFSIQKMELREGVRASTRIPRMLERLLPKWMAERLDTRLMLATLAHWRRKFPYYSGEEFNNAFKSKKNESRAHPDNQSVIILARYREQLNKYGLSHD